MTPIRAEEYWEEVEKEIAKVFDDPNRVEAIKETFVYADKKGFEKEITDAVDEGRQRVAQMEKTRKVSNELRGGFLAASFQYDSAVFGQWFRFRLEDKGSRNYLPTRDPLRNGSDNSLYSRMDQEYVEDLLGEAPRANNLIFSQFLSKPFCVQFGGRETKPKGQSEVARLHVDDATWKALQRVVHSPSRISLRELLLSRPPNLLDVFRVQGGTLVVTLLRKFDDVLRKKILDDNGTKWLGRALSKWRMDEPDDWAKRLRTFLFTFFYTILQKGPPRGHAVIYHVIIPLRTGKSWIGSFCGAYGLPPFERIGPLRAAYYGICRRLYATECLALRSLPRTYYRVGENIVRLCSIVPKPGAPVPFEMDQWRRKLGEKIKKLYKGNLYNESKNEFHDKELEKIAGRIVSASPVIVALLDQIASRFAGDVKPGKETLRQQTLFLYSSPGLGKESLARLCHYFSARALAKRVIERQIRRSWNKLRSAGVPWSKRTLFDDARKHLKLGDMKLNATWNRNRSFNYAFMNCGTLSQENFGVVLFGSKKDSGLLTRVSALGGSVFLDEVNTTPKEVINGLLRALEDPFVVQPVGTRAQLPLNLLLIFASNVRLRALVDDPKYGFNPAFADRINAELTVPPLSERKEDIPLIVNKILRDKNESGAEKMVRFVDLAGLRLLMELPWERNVRTIKNFVDDLMNVRSGRTLSETQFQRITFEEIVECAVRGAYLERAK